MITNNNTISGQAFGSARIMTLGENEEIPVGGGGYSPSQIEELIELRKHIANVKDNNAKYPGSWRSSSQKGAHRSDTFDYGSTRINLNRDSLGEEIEVIQTFPTQQAIYTNRRLRQVFSKEEKPSIARRFKAIFSPDSHVALTNTLRTSYSELRKLLLRERAKI